MNPMFHYPILCWDEWLSTLATLAVSMSCLLLINAMPRTHRDPEQVFLFTISVGAFGIAVTPFVDALTHPSFPELIFRVGVGIFAVWLSWPHWCELPGLNRRGGGGRVSMRPPGVPERRGRGEPA